MSVKRTERGWAGHFIGGASCMFRRNTLLESAGQRVVISTVGGYCPTDGKIMTIGSGGRYYETMAFTAREEGPYVEIDVSGQLSFDSEWAICAESPENLPADVDNQADKMHEAVVAEFHAKLLAALEGEK